EGRQEQVLEPAPAAIRPSREHEFRGHALGLCQVRELVNGWTAEPSVADRLARRVFVYPLLPVISIGEDAKVRINPFSIPSCVARMRRLQASVWDLRRSGTCVIVGGWPRRPGMVHPIATSNFSIARSHGPLVKRLPIMDVHPCSSRTLPRIRSLA